MAKTSRHFARLGKALVPHPLAPGDTVGVVAASGPPVAGILAQGIEFIERSGFRVLVGHNIGDQDGYLAGADEARKADLNTMFRNPEVRAVFLARGGYGIMRILDAIDLDAITRDPKLIVGMSDVTALQLSLYARCRLLTLSGPMLAGQVGEGLDPQSEEWFLRVLTNPLEAGNFFPAESPVQVIRPGTAQGPLLGGCLSLVSALMGTPHAPDYSGAILLLEDVGEAPYRIDRMLTQLRLAGVLRKASGIVIGHFIGTDGTDLAPAVERLAFELTQSHPVPIVSRFPHGHALPNLTLPHGAWVKLDTRARSMTVEVGGAQ